MNNFQFSTLFILLLFKSFSFRIMLNIKFHCSFFFFQIHFCSVARLIMLYHISISTFQFIFHLFTYTTFCHQEKKILCYLNSLKILKKKRKLKFFFEFPYFSYGWLNDFISFFSGFIFPFKREIFLHFCFSLDYLFSINETKFFLQILLNVINKSVGKTFHRFFSTH